MALSNHQPERLRPLLLVVGATTVFGTIGTVRVLGPTASSWSVGALRLLIAMALLVVIARLVDARADERWPLPALLLRPPTLAAGLGQAGFQVTFLAAVELTGVAVSTLVAIGSAPVFSGLLSRSVGRDWLVATALALLGLTLLLGGAEAEVSAYGVATALAAGLCYATYTFSSGLLAAAGHPPTSVTAAGFSVAGVLLAPALLVTDNRWALTGQGLVMVLYLAVVATVVAYLLFVAALRHLSAPTVQVVGLLEPVVATLLGVLVLGERLEPLASLGLLLVLAGLVVIARGVVARRTERRVGARG